MIFSHTQRASAGIALTLAGLLLAGCSHEAPPNAVPSPSDMAAKGNPPAGQPNHQSPEMQAQIDHYKALSNGGAQPAAPSH